MTRQYQIQKITGKPDWKEIKKAPIDQRLWLPCEQISAYAQLAYDDSRLYVHLHAEEPQIRAENTGVLDQPCQDSCLEFFFSAAEQDARYINIELNPSLCIYFGFGTGREELMRILLPDGAKTLHAGSEITANGWDVTYEPHFHIQFSLWCYTDAREILESSVVSIAFRLNKRNVRKNLRFAKITKNEKLLEMC